MARLKGRTGSGSAVSGQGTDREFAERWYEWALEEPDGRLADLFLTISRPRSNENLAVWNFCSRKSPRWKKRATRCWWYPNRLPHLALQDLTLLLSLKGIGGEAAAILWTEGLSRHFDNRRQVAAYAGLAPTPWQSGQINREQGVSKAGNPRLRTALIQISWLWIQHQPDASLTRWFKTRVVQNGGRLKKPTIVALARKLIVALWKYVNAGVVIEGAIMKTA